MATHSPLATAVVCRQGNHPLGTTTKQHPWLQTFRSRCRSPGRRSQCPQHPRRQRARAASDVPCHHFDPRSYGEQLEAKARDVARRFSFAGVGHGARAEGGSTVKLEVLPSPTEHYRLRCRFGISESGKSRSGLTYVMGPERTPLEGFPVASLRINELMPLLLDLVTASWDTLAAGLKEVHFLTTLSAPNDAVVTLMYDRRSSLLAGSSAPRWRMAASAAAQSLGPNVSIVGRTRGAREVVGRDYVTETLVLEDGRRLEYRQVAGSFSNPNGAVNQKTLDWLCRAASHEGPRGGDRLLELYCGCGNHTVALSAHYTAVVAVEIDPALVAAAEHNLRANGVDNARVVCAPSADYGLKVLQDPGSILGIRTPVQGSKRGSVVANAISTVLVDPPRAGLDEVTLRACAGFDRVLYISCNPDTLEPALRTLLETHDLKRMALLDHFPYTSHVECGVYLTAHR